MHPSYKKILELRRKSSLFTSLEHLLDWDTETKLPKKGLSLRAEQRELLSSLNHQSQTSKSYRTCLSKLIDLDSSEILTDDLSDEQIACVKQLRRDYLIHSKLPASFVKKEALLTASSTHIWAEARKNNDFKSYEKILKQIVDLSRKKADYLGYSDHPYDALADLFEPNIKTKEIHKLFAQIRQPLIDLAKKPQDIDTNFLYGKFDENKQFELAKSLLEDMGLEKDKTRLDLSTHPFCMPINSNDVRLTTRTSPSEFFQNLSATLHEGGHALYELGLLDKYYGSPLGESISLGIHESQSKIWETCIGQSKPFWTYFYPKVQSALTPLKDISLDKFYRAINKIEPSLIRIHADEVTYNLHVILRFEIEVMLIEGSLSVANIPRVWQEKSHDLLGIVPKTDREGCLQDIHWSMGAFGYFPTYALGNFYANQFFAKFKETRPGYKKDLESGNLLIFKEWLNENIHQHGRRYTSKELIKRVTGKPLSSDAFLQYIDGKYS